MQLVYIWVEEYDSLKDFGINLSSKYMVNFDKQSNKLEISETQEEYALFKVITGEYNCVNDLVALVGANGTGKTTILRCIHFLQNFDGNRGVIPGVPPLKYVLIYLLNNKLYLCTNIKHISLTNDNNIDIEVFLGNSLERSNLTNNFKTVFYSNIFDNIFSTPYNYSIDISTNTQLIKSLFPDSNSYLTNTINDWTRFVNSEYSTSLPISKKLKLRIQIMMPNKHINTKSETDMNGLREHYNILNDITPSPIARNLKESNLKGFLHTNIDYLIYKHQNIIEYFDSLKQDSDDNYIDRVIVIIKHIISTSNCSVTKKQIQDILIIFDFLSLENSVLDNGEIPLNKALELSQMLDKCEQSVKESICIQPINLSSGEIAKLNIYSRFCSILKYDLDESSFNYSGKYITSNDSEFTIIVDECDAYLHPEWQRSFLTDLFEMCETLFYSKKINFIITTHSPIILSDIPKDNIVYLSKDSDNRISTFKCETNTFGANIYNLYSNSFFLDKKENVIMGDIATKRITYVRDKIIEIKENINQSIMNHNFRINIEKDLNNCANIVSAIGEDVVKNYLQSELNYINEKVFKTDSNNLNVITDLYKKLPTKDKEKFIQFIVDSNKQH